jgi:hypothetical protein
LDIRSHLHTSVYIGVETRKDVKKLAQGLLGFLIDALDRALDYYTGEDLSFLGERPLLEEGDFELRRPLDTLIKSN